MTEEKHNNEILKELHSKTGCAKGFVNGPCGGEVNGRCETDETRYCTWVLVYEELKKNGKLEKFLNQYIEPKKLSFKS
ncbi:MAG: methylenetetrahydrofolate reductase C-terminal domain-containing protein [Endomicrobium sp.]|jgi:hypothetical protein|nr:methylenetetrahydrofolate reductase C-terminal domain-containing protein [Endomicrobium sp.]